MTAFACMSSSCAEAGRCLSSVGGRCVHAEATRPGYWAGPRKLLITGVDLSALPRNADLAGDGTDANALQLVDCKLTPTRDRTLARVGLYLVLGTLALVALGALIAWSLA